MNLTNVSAKEYIKNVQGSCIVIEEATSVVNAMKDNTLTDSVIGCEHNLNIVILVFHAILDVPKYKRISRRSQEP